MKMTIFGPYFLITHKGDHPQNYISFSIVYISMYTWVSVFIFTNCTFFIKIKWKTCMYRCIRTFLSGYSLGIQVKVLIHILPVIAALHTIGNVKTKAKRWMCLDETTKCHTFEPWLHLY